TARDCTSGTEPGCTSRRGSARHSSRSASSPGPRRRSWCYNPPDVERVPHDSAVTGPRVAGLTGATLQTAPEVCHGCVWWQSRSGKPADKRRWIEKAEAEWGAWGTVYYDADGRLLGSMQYGPAELFPRAAELPAGPPSADAVLVTCAYLVELSAPWVMQSLFLAAIGDARDKGAKALETF